jgi:tetratricopeptide (TPR) repeat protein
MIAAQAAAAVNSNFFTQGLTLHADGHLEQAISAFIAAQAAAPGHVESGIALGHCLLDAKRDDASPYTDALATHHPEDARVLILKARASLAEGHAAAAIGTLTLVLALEPANAAAHAGLANALAAHGEVERAVQHAMMAFRLVPDPGHASNFSSTLIMGGHYTEARVLAEYALARQPGHFGALVNRATALDVLGDMPEALRTAQRAVAAAPDNVTGRLMLAGLYLRLGHLTDAAWSLYEARHQLGNGPPAWMQGPVWNGEPIAGRTILLQAEQGYGDTLQFVRYAPLVAQRAGRVILAVQPALLRLLRQVPGVDQVIARDAPLPPFDVVCPLLSLPRIFGTTLQTIPPPLPYADEAPPLEPSDTLRVGLVWAGNPGFPLDAQRSLPAEALSVLSGIPHVQFYSLQLQPAAWPPGLDMIDRMDGVQDFADTAARIAGLDLVIAADTAVAHLAATMGKPVWLLSRFRGCWRWLHDRPDSPWYPTLRVLRQTEPRNWDPILVQVRRDLAALQPPARASTPR